MAAICEVSVPTAVPAFKDPGLVMGTPLKVPPTEKLEFEGLGKVIVQAMDTVSGLGTAPRLHFDYSRENSIPSKYVTKLDEASGMDSGPRLHVDHSNENSAVNYDMKLEAVGEPEMVVPAAHTPTERFYLSNMDLLFLENVATVFSYRANGSKSTENLAQTLKNALAKVLVPYHFCCGRLVLNPDSKRLEIDLNRKGVQVSHYRSGLSLADLGELKPPHPALEVLFPRKFDAARYFDLPLVAYQLTTFKCGGWTLGLIANHAVFDATSAVDFLLNLASMARKGEMFCTPVTDRKNSLGEGSSRIDFEHPELLMPELVHPRAIFKLPEQFDTDHEPEHEEGEFVTRTIPFSSHTIGILKSRALLRGVNKTVTSFEALTAHIWQCWTRCVELKEDRPFNVCLAVNCRSRLAPPVDAHYVGNVVHMAVARACPEEVRRMAYPEAVRRIHQAVSDVDDAYIRSTIDWKERHKGTLDLAGGFYITNWVRMPFYKVDFGWGRPIYAGPVQYPLMSIMILLPNYADDGGCSLVINLPSKQMVKFERQILVEHDSSVER